MSRREPTVERPRKPVPTSSCYDCGEEAHGYLLCPDCYDKASPLKSLEQPEPFTDRRRKPGPGGWR